MLLTKSAKRNHGLGLPKARLVCLLTLAFILFNNLLVLRVFAATDPRWNFDWIDKTTVKLTDKVQNKDFTFKGTVSNTGGNSDGDGSFTASVTFPNGSKPCTTGISFYIDKSIYSKPIDTSKPTIIKDGNYAPPTKCTTLVSDDLVRYLRSKKAQVNFTSSTNTSSFAGSGSGSNGSQSDDNSCETKGGALGWILCAVVRGVDDALNWLDTQIQALLEIDNTSFNNPQIKSAWSSIRNFAYIILLPIMLVMVIGTALGSNLIDAYTAKKALPRMLIAVVFITLSYYICTFLIQFFNVVGAGTLGILTSPFHNLKDNLTLASLYKGSPIQAILAGPIAAGVVFMLWLFGGTLVLFAGVAFLVLLLRQMFIVAALLVAPLAILAWIFPGNNKLWKDWWGLFSKLLIMFPLIMGVIAVGRIFAVIIHDGSAGDGGLQGAIIKPLAIMFAWMLPYAFIPFTFKFAGGLFATLSGFANDKSKGLFDRQKQKRADKLERARDGNIIRTAPPGSWRDKLNKAGQVGMNIKSAGLRPGHMRDNMTTALGARNFEAANEFLEKNMSARAIKGDDDKMWAASHGRNAQEVEDILKARAPERFADPQVRRRAVAEVMRFKKEAGNDVSKIAATIAQAGTGTGFNYRDDGTDDDMINAIIDAAGDDRGLSGRMLATMRQSAMQSGRVDLAGGGFAKQAMVMDRRREAMVNNGYSAKRDANGRVVFDAAGNKVMEAYGNDEARLDILQDVLQSNGGAAVAGKVESVKQLAPVMKAQVDQALQNGDEIKAVREFAKIAGKYDAAAQIAPQNAEALADGILAQGIVTANLPQNIQTLFNTQGKSGITYQQAIEQLRSNEDFQTMRREYQTSGLAAAQAAQAAALQQPGQPPGGLPPIPGVPGR